MIKPKNIINDTLYAQYYWDNMNRKERKRFLIVLGLHNNYIENTIGKNFKDLENGLKVALKYHKTPKNIIMAKKRKKQKAIVVGTTGKGKTYSMEYAINNKVKMPKPPKREKKKIVSKSFVGLGKTMPTERYIRNRLSINTTNISKFLNTLTDAEFIYLSHTMDTAIAMRDIIKKYDVSIERFCKEMSIEKKQFNSYMKGSCNFDLKDISKLNALAHTLYMENAEKNAEESMPIKTPRPKKQ